MAHRVSPGRRRPAREAGEEREQRGIFFRPEAAEDPLSPGARRHTLRNGGATRDRPRAPLGVTAAKLSTRRRVLALLQRVARDSLRRDRGRDAAGGPRRASAGRNGRAGRGRGRPHRHPGRSPRARGRDHARMGPAWLGGASRSRDAPHEKKDTPRKRRGGCRDGRRAPPWVGAGRWRPRGHGDAGATAQRRSMRGPHGPPRRRVRMRATGGTPPGGDHPTAGG